jgi:hypothetical protein
VDGSKVSFEGRLALAPDPPASGETCHSVRLRLGYNKDKGRRWGVRLLQLTSRARDLRAESRPCRAHCWTCSRNVCMFLHASVNAVVGRWSSNLRTLRLLCNANLVLYLECFTRVDDINDRAGSRRFEVLQKCPRVATVRVRRVYALCREVV